MWDYIILAVLLLSAFSFQPRYIASFIMPHGQRRDLEADATTGCGCGCGPLCFCCFWGLGEAGRPDGEVGSPFFAQILIQ
jgi:hypothetical protein